MRKFFSILAAAALVTGISAKVFGADTTVKGELVDQACFTKDAKNVGSKHADCATTCAKKGSPVALVADDGVYMVTGDMTKDNNAQLVPHMAHIVELTGEVSEKDGHKMINATALKMISAAN
jgi:hypothetical protein